MRKEKLIIFGLFAVIILGAVILQVSDSGGSIAEKKAPPPLKPSTAGEFRGICLQIHGNSSPYEKYIDEISRTGANTVSIVIHAYQENGASTSIFIEARKNLPDEKLVELIAHAKSRGLRVVLMPVVLLENPIGDEWRGKINPTNWNDWWSDYNDLIMHYARLSQQAGVDVFLVGSELNSTQKNELQWRALIKKVRENFHGKLCYSANWDCYDKIQWWDAVDIVGMTGYYNLTKGDEPTVERLIEGWSGFKEKILAFQKQVNRPIMFTEAGWPNMANCGEEPWNYCRESIAADPQAQANCFEAFFRTWYGEPSVAGYLVWEWRNSESQTIGPEDKSYRPCGKPAMDVIRKYFQLPEPAARSE